MANYKVISNGPLNLRSEANTNSAILAKIPQDTIIQDNRVMKQVAGWVAVSYGKLTGYVSSQYLTSTYQSPTETKKENNSNQNSQNNQNNQKMALTLSENAKKYLKIGLVALGVGAAGLAVYKMSQNSNKPSSIAPRQQTQPALNGTSKKRKKRVKQSSSKKRIKLT